MGYKSKIVVFDFETAGLDNTKHPAMELGVVTLDRLTLEEEIIYETLIKKYEIFGKKPVYDPKALEVHGIDPARCEREGKEVKDIAKDLIKLFKEITPKGDRGGNKPILCGHNVAFDISFLEVLFIEADMLEEFHSSILSNNGIIKGIDTQEMAIDRWNNGNQQSFALGACCEKAGLGNFLAHSALADTRITADLLRYLIQTGKGSSEGVSSAKSTKEVGKRARQSSNRKTKFQF